ncbi:MAG TPA: DUF1993 domain-containing protein [Alphaproteobacteria bacterium]|nr:DUF1993 domain-containing protein [Alphaproteobacteria bacterium]
MTISMYQASVPVMVRSLNNLIAILGKATAHADAKKVDPDVFGGCRLIADMHPLSRQIQIASDVAKGGAARLAGVEPPSWADDEKTMADLVERLKKTISYLESLKPEQIDGSEDRKVTLKVGPNTVDFQGLPYLLNFVLPNVLFHVTTAYNILRENGVDIGKRDFIGGI